MSRLSAGVGVNRLDRRGAILDMLADGGQVEIEDVVRRLAVSPATARRDLDALAEQQLLTRTRGGAVARSIAYDLPLRYKDGRAAAQKSAIAAAASSLVTKGSVVGLCGGTTATAIATALVLRDDIMEPTSSPTLTVVTNAVNIASSLSVRPQIKTVVTGGVVNAHSYELVGPYAESVLDRITLDIAFIGANGVDPVHGPTTFDEREATVNALMAGRSARAVLVVDSSKFGRTAFAKIGSWSVFDTVITDDGVSDDQRAVLADLGLEVIVAATSPRT